MNSIVRVGLTGSVTSADHAACKIKTQVLERTLKHLGDHQLRLRRLLRLEVGDQYLAILLPRLFLYGVGEFDRTDVKAVKQRPHLGNIVE